jgi:hypothetical protein
VTVPAAPSAGNSVLANELPTQTEAIEPISARTGTQGEDEAGERLADMEDGKRQGNATA